MYGYTHINQREKPKVAFSVSSGNDAPKTARGAVVFWKELNQEAWINVYNFTTSPPLPKTEVVVSGKGDMVMVCHGCSLDLNEGMSVKFLLLEKLSAIAHQRLGRGLR